jgi:hypothetical protein
MELPSNDFPHPPEDFVMSDSLQEMIRLSDLQQEHNAELRKYGVLQKALQLMRFENMMADDTRRLPLEDTFLRTCVCLDVTRKGNVRGMGIFVGALYMKEDEETKELKQATKMKFVSVAAVHDDVYSPVEPFTSEEATLVNGMVRELLDGDFKGLHPTLVEIIEPKEPEIPDEPDTPDKRLYL